MKEQTCGEWQVLEKQREREREREHESAVLELQKPLIERLFNNKDRNPAAATVLAQEFLLEWRAGHGDNKLEEAISLLNNSANQGDPEASYTLATLKPEVCSENGRADLIKWATQCGHERALIEQEGRKAMEEAAGEESYIRYLDDYAKRLKQDIDGYRAEAESGNAYAQCRIGKLLHERGRRFSLEAGEDPDIGDINEALFWIEQSSASLPEARAYLALHWNHEPEEKLKLLERAINQWAFKGHIDKHGVPDGFEVDNDYTEAICALADIYEEKGDLASAKALLEQQNMGEWKAECRLAMLYMKHGAAIPGYFENARKLLKLDKKHPFLCDDEVALRAALMLIRGEGGNRDFDRARELLKSIARPNHRNNDLNVICANLALALGWGGVVAWEVSMEKLIRRLSLNGFASEAELPISWDDLSALYQNNKELINTNARLASYKSKNEEFAEVYEHLGGMSPFGVFGWTDFVRVPEALFTVLSTKQIIRSNLEGLLLNPNSMVDHFIWGELWLSGRLGDINYQAALEHLEKTIQLGHKAAHNAAIGPLYTHVNEFREWLLNQARATFNRALTEKHRQEVEDSRRDAMETMMAMFSHKFRGAVDSILFNTAHQHDERVYLDAAHTMNGLLDIFSVASTHPDKLLGSLKEDTSGEGSPSGVLLHSIKLVLIQMLSLRNRRRMSPYYLSYAKKHGKAPQGLRLSTWAQEKPWQELEESLRAHWEQEVGEMVVTASLHVVNDWMRAHLLPVRVDGFIESKAQFSKYGPKASLLTVIFTEVLVNAIKHSAPDSLESIEFSWRDGSEETELSCINPSSRESRMREASKGSGRGHNFLGLIANNLHGHFDADVFRDVSRVSITLPSIVMMGDAK